MSAPLRSRQPRVCIIGAGFGGIATAAQLSKRGIDATIFESTDDVGGVWHDDAYLDPAAVDAKKRVAELVDEHHLSSSLELGSTVTHVTWDDARQEHVVMLASGERRAFDVVVSAVGVLNTPKVAGWKGLTRFRGPVFHAARWEHSRSLAGKRVAIVGSGATGAQLTVSLAPHAGHVRLFQRAAGWVVADDARAPVWGSQAFVAGSPANETARTRALEKIRGVLGHRPDLLEAVTPEHSYLAKMPGRVDGFYETLLRDDVTLVPQAVAALDETGVIDVDDTHYDADVVILATGYRVADYLGEIEVRGRDGRSLEDAWHGEPEAFLGMSVPGFPNFYMVHGPNSFMGDETAQLATQATAIARDVRRMARHAIATLEVRARAHDHYNTWLQNRLDKTVWATTDNSLQSASGQLVVPFPGSAAAFALVTRVLRRAAMTARPVTTPFEPRGADRIDTTRVLRLRSSDLVGSGRV